MVLQSTESATFMVESGGVGTASVVLKAPAGVSSVVKLQSASKHFEFVNNGSLGLLSLQDEDSFQLLTMSSVNELMTMRGELNIGNLPNSQSMEVSSTGSSATLIIDAPRQVHTLDPDAPSD